MQNNLIYIQQLTDILKTINPYKVLLFGSYAYGTPTQDSDIDLLVVTNDNYLPQNYDERMNLHLSISNQIFELAKQVPIDLIVYTIPMFKKFIEQNSSFANEITTKGKILYEGNNTTMA